MELLDAYDINGNLVKTADRKSLIAEIKAYSLKHGDAHLAVPCVYLFLSHPEKGVYIIKRANKSENPFLWCKPVGGHINSGEDPDNALLRESMEEINIRLKFTRSIDEYFDMLKTDPLTECAVIRKIDYNPWYGTYRLDRDTGKSWLKRSVAHVYVGRLRKELGFTKAADLDFSDGLGEAVAYAIMPTDELLDLLSKKDPRFTNDLDKFMQDYHVFL